MSLSREQKHEAKKLSEQYLDVFHKWSKNPANFEHNISCLKELRTVVISYMNMIMPYVQNGVSQAGKGGFFNMMKSRHEIEIGLEIANQIKGIMFDEETVRKTMRKYFAKEPRITALSANINISENDNMRGGQIKHEEKETFTITFKDGTNLTLNSLNDEKSLAEAKRFFEEKLESLEMGQRRVFGMN